MIDSSTLAGRRVVITGASGFLGSHLRGRLQRIGAEVHGVSRTHRRAAAADEPATCWWQADTSDLVQVEKLFQETRPNVIFHLSGLSSAAPGIEMVLPTFQSLLGSAVNVMTVASHLADCRVVLAASLTEPSPGQAEPTPSSPYAAAKWAAGTYARMFHRLYGLPVVMVRPFMTYGPYQDRRKIIPYMTLSLLGGTAPELSSGTQQFDWIYVDDVTDGFIAAAVSSNLEGSTIDLGSGSAMSVREIADRLVQLLDTPLRPVFGARENRPLELVRTANLEEAFAKLRWRPTVSLDEGLRRTVEWYRHEHDRNTVAIQ